MEWQLSNAHPVRLINPDPRTRVNDPQMPFAEPVRLAHSFSQLLARKPIGDASVGPLGSAWRKQLEIWRELHAENETTVQGARRAEKRTHARKRRARRDDMVKAKLERRARENIAWLAVALNDAFADARDSAMERR